MAWKENEYLDTMIFQAKHCQYFEVKMHLIVQEVCLKSLGIYCQLVSILVKFLKFQDFRSLSAIFFSNRYLKPSISRPDV